MHRFKPPLTHDLPPLLTLRVFEAVARHLSFFRAADELAVTPSAVSHQIQKLEQHLGLPLFVRRTRSIDLTPEGNTYYDKVRRALEGIAGATREIREIETRRKPVRVSLLSSFATHWLAPRLSGFNSEHPDVHLQLLPSIELATVGAGAVDIAIRYGEGHWPNVKSSLLMRERLSPVCSPDYLRAHGPFERADELKDGPLLMSYAIQQFEWDAWGAQFSSNLARLPKIMMHDYNIVLEAAAAGQGVAMGRHRLIERRLADGTLVEVFPGSAHEGVIGYWLVSPDKPLDEAARRFVNWIQQVGSEQTLKHADR